MTFFKILLLDIICKYNKLHEILIMTKTFDLLRYKKLLNQEKKGEIPFFNSELIGFKRSIADQLLYDHKKKYFVLISKYLNRFISSYRFRSKLLEMYKKDTAKLSIILNNFQKLEIVTFTDTVKVKQVSDLISQIITLSSEYNETWDGTVKVMSESEFYDLIKNYYLQLENY